MTPVRNNRLNDYEAGWLAFLVERGLATREDAVAAQRRVAIEAIQALERRARRKKRKRPKDD